MSQVLPDVVPSSFVDRKSKILQQLAVPDSDYTDLSPKGSVDESIRDLIDEINEKDGLVTTSSCGGRVSVFLEGRKDIQPLSAGPDDNTDASDLTQAGVGGKGGGGTWLFVSHDPIDEQKLGGRDDEVLNLFGLDGVVEDAAKLAKGRLIHFKLEPMILHVLTASPAHAQLILKSALPSGFRESGALNITPDARGSPATPMVAVRTMGLGFSSLIGYEAADGTRNAVVSAAYLRTLLGIGNARFVENARRIDRFRTALRDASTATSSRGKVKVGEDGAAWEDAAVRKERKRAEGLRRKAELAAAAAAAAAASAQDVSKQHSDIITSHEPRSGDDMFDSRNESLLGDP